MRVLHINVSYIVSALHQTMIEHLNQLGIESKVFVPTYDKTRSIVDCKEYVTLSECFKKWDRVFYFIKQTKIIQSIMENYDVKQFDIIHAYTLFTDGNAAMELSKTTGIPYVVAVRNTDVNDFFKKMIHLRKHGVKVLENASAVFFLSPVYRDVVIKKHVPEHLREAILRKSHIIPNGIDDFWHDHVFERDADSVVERIEKEKILKCIYVGGIDKNKNIELTLNALAKLNTQGWKCTLTSIGKIVDRAVYERLCKYPFFSYVAPKKKEELIDYYREADIFIMPSHTETFGLVYAEAMSQGLPVIYTRGQGFDGQFPDGEVGYAVSDTESEQIVSAIKRIVESYKCISSKCIIGIRRFSWDDIAAEYRKIYHTIERPVVHK